jgi:hypothetical protein
MLLLALVLTGCGGIGQVVKALAQGAQSAAAVGNALDLAETGANLYFARHPSPHANDVTLAIQGVRSLLNAYAAAVKAGEGVAEAEAALRSAYDNLVELLESRGVLNGEPPAGGAETEAPLPEPFHMPPSEVLLGA